MGIELGTTADGIDVYDSIEKRQVRIDTSLEDSIDVGDGDKFAFPVDKRCTFETSALVFDQVYSVTIHEGTGRSEDRLEVGDSVRLESCPQFVGLSGPIKLYCRTDTPGSVEVGLTSVRIEFDERTEITVGIRSLHDRPAATITTPPDLESMTEAVSMLPSALKTLSPERTWPTLRGHPPRIELGDNLEVPDALERPDNGVTVTIPPSYQSLFQAAPLAFYLGATITTGSEPTVSAGSFERRLADSSTFEDDVAQLLKRVFFLDCLSRTEGIFQYDLYERSMLEDALPFDLAETYEMSLPERLERYLSVPYDLIAEYVPRWPLTAHLPDEPDAVEVVPFIINELGIVRGTQGTRMSLAGSPSTTNTGFVRSTRSEHVDETVSPTADRTLVEPAVTDEAIEHAWFGDGVPRGASKATLEAYRNQLSRISRTESIEILLVCNDARMLEEHDLLDETYGNRESLPFEIHSEFGVEADRLAELFAHGGYDFVHYIGHATEDGIRCPDTDLDVRTLESVDLGVFFLNACRSYEQGLALTRRGAFGGVTTCRDVDNEHAVEIGATMARLLNRGFPLRAALEVSRRNSTLGEEYLIVGDGSTDLAQTDGGAPSIIELQDDSEAEYGFAIRSYSTKEFKLGTATASNLSAVDDRHLSPGGTPFSRVETEPLREYLTWTELPILADGELHWNGGIGSSVLE